MHKFDENVSSAVKEIYPIEHATTLIEEENDDTTPKTGLELLNWMKEQVIQSEKTEIEMKQANHENNNNSNKKSRIKKMILKVLLGQRGGGLSMYGQDIVTHVILQAKLEPNMKITLSKDSTTDTGTTGGGGDGDDDGRELSISLDQCNALMEVYNEAKKIYASLDTPGQPGYIFCNGEVSLLMCFIITYIELRATEYEIYNSSYVWFFFPLY